MDPLVAARRHAFHIISSGNKDEWTRREMLSSLASIFDPMGLVDPARLSAKHFFQKIWLKQKEQELVPRTKSE